MITFKEYTLFEGLRDLDKMTPEQKRLFAIMLLSHITLAPPFSNMNPDEAFEHFLNLARETWPEMRL